MDQASLGVLPVGSCFHGRYEVVRILKTGGMGGVYEVVDRKTRRRRALKIMLPSSVEDPDLRARFKLEATITADVETDHILETFDADIDEETGSPFLVTELLKGEDLAAVLQQRGRMEAEEVVTLLGQVARALDKTHAAGIVHRDLKPENLFLVRTDDGSPRVKVLDFGIAKVVAQGSARTTRVMGTPLYMSREQILGEGTIGPASDLYAFGHLAYTLLVGEAYWDRESRASPAQYVFFGKVMAGAQEPATVRAARGGVTLPPPFDGWFLRATALDAAFRFESASEMIGLLAQILGVAAPRALDATPRPSASSLEPPLPAPPPALPSLSIAPPAQPAAPMATGAPAVSEVSPARASRGRRAGKVVAGGAALAVVGALGVVAFVQKTAPEPAAALPRAALPTVPATEAKAAKADQRATMPPEPAPTASIGPGVEANEPPPAAPSASPPRAAAKSAHVPAASSGRPRASPADDDPTRTRTRASPADNDPTRTR